jgi:acyl-CoA synthetase (NDP forming)
LDAVLEEMFGEKGQTIVRANQRACRLGRNAAAAYRGGLANGVKPQRLYEWLEAVPAESFLEPVAETVSLHAGLISDDRLTAAEEDAVAQILRAARAENRSQLYEHEVYEIVEVIGAIRPPRHQFVPMGACVREADLAALRGERLMLKIVSPHIVHKSDVGGLMAVAKDVHTVNDEIGRMMERHAAGGATIAGVLAVEYIERSESGFGQELFVGVRSTREFGPIIAAGLGGIDTEYLATKLKPEATVAKGLATEISAEAFFRQFARTAVYDIVSGKARGHHCVVGDGELRRCFRGFLALAKAFGTPREDGLELGELEVNPFAFVGQQMVPLDGRGRLERAPRGTRSRPLAKVRRLLEPESVAVLGVSTKRHNFGRIILHNVLDCGYPPENLFVVKEGMERIDGVQCVARLNRLPRPVDLLVVAAAAEHMPELMDQVVESGKAESIILIPGGMGETPGTESMQSKVRERLVASRDSPGGGPVVIGANSLGVRSRPGRYDTFFIPPDKQDARRWADPKPVALISQSGAFMVSRLSNLELLDPILAISLGNQIDVTVSDVLRVVGERPDVHCLGVYVEGFNELDGLEFVRAVESITEAGKIIVFYKAGRTPSGRAAAAGHTASVAGDYDVCQSAAAQAGAIVTDTFKEFEQLLEIAALSHDKAVSGRRIAAISNAGFEAVGMADNIVGARYQLEMAGLSPGTVQCIAAELAKYGLSKLINVRNPLDLTPMADDDVYEACIRAMIDDENVDGVIVSLVPLTPQLLTTETEIEKPASLAWRLPLIVRESPKPIIAVVDAGNMYDALAHALREGGVPTFRSADQAVRSFGRYLCHRTANLETSKEPSRDRRGAVHLAIGRSGDLAIEVGHGPQ